MDIVLTILTIISGVVLGYADITSKKTFIKPAIIFWLIFVVLLFIFAPSA